MIQRYLGKLSGPLLDRIDLHIEVPAVPYKELRGAWMRALPSGGEDAGAGVHGSGAAAAGEDFYNAHIPPNALRKLTALDDAGERTLEMAARRLGLIGSGA